MGESQAADSDDYGGSDTRNAGDRPSSRRVWEVAATPAQASLMRGLLAEWARTHGASDALVADIVLAVHEAMTNAVRHAYPPDVDATMTVTATATRGDLALTVADTGQWRVNHSLPHGGRGLHLVHALAGAVSITRTSRGTTVNMWWPRTP